MLTSAFSFSQKMIHLYMAHTWMDLFNNTYNSRYFRVLLHTFEASVHTNCDCMVKNDQYIAQNLFVLCSTEKGMSDELGVKQGILIKKNIPFLTF